MKNKYTVSGLFVIFLIIIFYLIFSIETKKDDSVKDILIKNLNWDSPLKSEVPYVIGNEIELYYILETQSHTDFTINLKGLRQEFNISEIKIGENVLEIFDTIKFSLTQNTPLKITGIAKNNSNAGENNLRDLIEISSKQNKTPQVEIIPEMSIQEIPQNNISSEGNEINAHSGSKIKEENIIENIPETLNTDLFSGLQFNQTHFNSNINNLLEITGKDIEKIKYLNIGSYSFTPNIKDNTAYFLINQNTFTSGNYFVFIQPEQGNIIPLDTQMSFQYSGSDVNIANITPNQVNNKKDAYIVLQGNGFSDIISLQLNNNIILKKTSFEIINDKVLSVKIDKNIEPGIYSFNIMTTNNIIKIDNMNFTIIK